MTKAGPRTPGPRSPPRPRLGPLHTDTHSGGHSGLSAKLTLQVSCRVKLGCRGQGLERTPRHTEAPHPPRKQGQATGRLTYYRRLTPNRWVGRGAAAGPPLWEGAACPRAGSEAPRRICGHRGSTAVTLQARSLGPQGAPGAAGGRCPTKVCRTPECPVLLGPRALWLSCTCTHGNTHKPARVI